MHIFFAATNGPQRHSADGPAPNASRATNVPPQTAQTGRYSKALPQKPAAIQTLHHEGRLPLFQMLPQRGPSPPRRYRTGQSVTVANDNAFLLLLLLSLLFLEIDPVPNHNTSQSLRFAIRFVFWKLNYRCKLLQNVLLLINVQSWIVSSRLFLRKNARYFSEREKQTDRKKRKKETGGGLE